MMMDVLSIARMESQGFKEIPGTEMDWEYFGSKMEGLNVLFLYCFYKHNVTFARIYKNL
jgi:hypothetical protein